MTQSNRDRLDRRNKYYREIYNPKHREQLARAQKKYKESHREELIAKRIARRDETNRKQREYKFLLRSEVLVHYGNKCQCCGESMQEFLSIDHINGGGNKHKKITGGAGYPTYLWLKNNNYPDGFQVLCHNCNQAKHIYKICPHQRIKNETV
jgi:hypothetical protein